MKNIFKAFLGLALCFIIAASCNKTSLVGAELFENDKLNLQFTDTLTINALNDAPTPILMTVKGVSSYDNLPLGNMPDAYFGKLESQIYAQFGLQNVTLPSFPALDTGFIDSVRFIMPYYSAGTYGDTMQTQKLSVYRLTEQLLGDTIYSDKTFANATTPLGSLTFKPTPYSTVTRIIDTVKGRTTVIDTIVHPPLVNIPLDINFGKEIMRLGATLTDTAFQVWLKGLVIKSETPTNCMLSFNLSPTAGTVPTGQKSRIAGIYIYYRSNSADTTHDKYYAFYTSGQTRYANYKSDYKNGKIKDFVNNPKKADSLIFLQSISNAVTRLEFPFLKNLGTIAINKAELEFTINESSDTAIYPPLSQLLLLNSSANIPKGNLVNITNVLQLIPTNALAINDAAQTGFSATSFATIPDFGGYPIVEKGVAKYKMNITQHLNQILNGKEGTQITLVPHFQYTKAGRVVLYGPKHSKYRAKLNLIYTKI